VALLLPKHQTLARLAQITIAKYRHHLAAGLMLMWACDLIVGPMTPLRDVGGRGWYVGVNISATRGVRATTRQRIVVDR